MTYTTEELDALWEAIALHRADPTDTRAVVAVQKTVGGIIEGRCAALRAERDAAVFDESRTDIAALLAECERLREELRVGNHLCADLTDRQHDVERKRDAARNALEALEHQHRDCGMDFQAMQVRAEAAEKRIRDGTKAWAIFDEDGKPVVCGIGGQQEVYETLEALLNAVPEADATRVIILDDPEAEATP